MNQAQWVGASRERRRNFVAAEVTKRLGTMENPPPPVGGYLLFQTHAIKVAARADEQIPLRHRNAGPVVVVAVIAQRNRAE